MLILAEAEIEKVPHRYVSHPAVLFNAKKRGKRPSEVLLDSSLHHSVMDRKDGQRKGRPDITFQFLLLGLDSILNQDGRLDLFVHTVNDEMISISPETRLPKTYRRFYGLFEELFAKGSVPPGSDPLIRLTPGMDLKNVLDHVRSRYSKREEPLTLLMHPEGEICDLPGRFGSAEIKRDVICIIGGFPCGDFRYPVKKEVDEVLSLPGGELKVWSVEMEVLVSFRLGTLRADRTSGEA